MMRAIALTMTMLLLAGCSTDPHLMNTSNGGDGPDEFGIVPTKPLQMPEDLMEEIEDYLDGIEKRQPLN